MSSIASTSKLPPPIVPSKPSQDDIDIERILNQETSLLNREEEVMRIINAFKLNPYEILELNMMPSYTVTETEIHKTYRKKSLLIHPDKLKHARGIEAFDLLKKAETELLDLPKRKLIDETIIDARMLVLRDIKLPRELPDDDPRLVAMGRGDVEDRAKGDLLTRIKKKTKEILIDDELRRRRVVKMTMIAEGAEASRIEEAIEKRKRKVEEEKRWEDTREDRVTDWRSFSKGPKKKKNKGNVLG